MVQKTIEVAELLSCLDAVLGEVAGGRVRCVLARNGRPEAALISYVDFERFERLDRSEREFRARWERSRGRLAEANAHLTDQEIEAEVAAAVAEVRAARRAQRQDEAS